MQMRNKGDPRLDIGSSRLSLVAEERSYGYQKGAFVTCPKEASARCEEQEGMDRDWIRWWTFNSGEGTVTCLYNYDIITWMSLKGLQGLLLHSTVLQDHAICMCFKAHKVIWRSVMVPTDKWWRRQGRWRLSMLCAPEFLN